MQQYQKRSAILLALATVLILLNVASLQWSKVVDAPERVFWDMISGSLSTRSVSITASGSQNETNARQVTQYKLGGDSAAHAVSTLEQGGAKIKTEVIDTKEGQYTRYLSVEFKKIPQGGKLPDTKNIIGVWSRAELSGADDVQTSRTRLLSQVALGAGLPVGSVAVPIGNMSDQKRQHLVDTIRREKVYGTDFSKVGRDHKDKRLTYTYDVTLRPSSYVMAMKEFALAFDLDALADVRPETYRETAPLTLKFVVDVHTRRLVEVKYATGYSQKYGGYDILADFTSPKEAISVDELQRRVESL